MEQENTRDVGDDLQGSTILIVDDEPNIRELLSLYLTKFGFNVIKVSNGEEVLDIAMKEGPDIILLDIKMPGMDGLQVKAKLNENPSTSSIPVIFISGNTDVSDKVEGFNLGVDDYVTKPFNLKELKARVSSTLQRRKFYEDISMTDGLTGLPNVHYFKKQFSLFFNIAKRSERPFSLVIVDIDDFKKINDEHGHVLGDYVLRALSNIMCVTLRKSDVVTRYGGDEFAIILPGNTEEQAYIAMDRVKEQIEGKVFTCENTGEDISFSISRGAAVYSSDFENEDQMFKLADDKMYEDKNTKK